MKLTFDKIEIRELKREVEELSLDKHVLVEAMLKEIKTLMYKGYVPSDAILALLEKHEQG